MICGIIIMQINHHFSYQDKAAVKKFILTEEFSGFSPMMYK